uniref:Uncharacterized protein n=1 Tax=Strigamia maritima TaxID=126957 RepID=T1J7Y9_STRMM
MELATGHCITPEMEADKRIVIIGYFHLRFTCLFVTTLGEYKYYAKKNSFYVCLPQDIIPPTFDLESRSKVGGIIIAPTFNFDIFFLFYGYSPSQETPNVAATLQCYCNVPNDTLLHCWPTLLHCWQQCSNVRRSIIWNIACNIGVTWDVMFVFINYHSDDSFITTYENNCLF